MKQLMKKGLSLLLALVLIVSLLPAISLTADAATVDYRYSGNYIYNWGTREEVATFLSPNAEDFYEEHNVTYAELAGLSGSSNESSVPGSPLYRELAELMSGAQTYITSYNATKNLFQYTDCENNGSPSTISSFYSGTAIGPSWDGAWNREHTWPNSKGLGGSDEDDIMMLRPTSQTENSSRGNTGYGESTGYYHPNSESNGKHDLRGDVARIFLYVYVRWGNVNGNGEYDTWGSDGVMESKDVLLDWMEADPVDTWELGRNDSVESITGTRNVFVDYPELAFELFEEPVPVMQTPSGMANSAYTVSAVSSNTAHGTVSVSGTTITATPAEGYAVSGYELLSGSAAVSRNGNVFLVSPSSDCQIRINFTAKVPVSLNFVESSGAAASRTAYIGEAMTMPQHTGAVPENYTFRGWVTEQVQDSTSKPATVYAAGDSYTPSAAQTFYALYSWVEGEGSGEPVAKLVTSSNALSAGMTVIIASAEYDFAMSTTQNGNNRGQAAITKNSDNTIDYGDDVQIFTLEAGTVSGSYAFNTGNGYLYAASSSANWLRTKSALDANGSFTISVSSNGSCDVVAQGSYTRNNMEYNKASALFSCYPASNQQTPVAIYAITQSGTLHYVTAQDATFYIATHPTNVTVTVGPDAYFTVEAVGEGLTYQWQYRTSATGTWSNSPATGNNTATLTVPATVVRNGYQYRCAVTNENGATLYSNAATLTVTVPFAITVQPVDSQVKEGTVASFSVTATGLSLTYQWQYRTSEEDTWKNSPATGNKTATLQIPGTLNRSGYQYRCVITDGSGSILYTDAVTLTVVQGETVPSCLSYEITDGEVTITDCDTSASGELVIPETIEGYPVTTIGNYAFSDCYSLTSVTIGNSVTSVGERAFYNCTSLTSVTIPDGVTSIGDYAFYNCASLTSVTIGDRVTRIGKHAFMGCYSLTYNTYDTGKYLGNADNPYFALVDTTSENITDCAISEATKIIAGGVFQTCRNLNSITIPDSVTSIGNFAFEGCASLTSVTIPDSVTSIGNYAFYGCEGLISVAIPDSVTSIGIDAFYDCNNITTVYYGGTEAQWGALSNKPDCDDVVYYNLDGWVSVDGAWCYYENGKKLTNDWAQDSNGWYYMGSDGYAVKNAWTEDSSGVYYMDETGRAVKNTWAMNEGGWMYIGSDKHPVTNTWAQDSAGWYYMGADGYAVKNAWTEDSSGWYYMDSTGRAVKNTWAMNTKGWMYIGSDKHPVTNAWVQDSAGWYYMGADGYAVKNTWVMNTKGWMYIGSNKHPVTNDWAQDSAGWYFMGADGYAVKNAWTKDSTGWYYMDSTGRAVKNGWAKDSGGWLYMGADGHALKNRYFTVDGVQYYADATGHVQ